MAILMTYNLGLDAKDHLSLAIKIIKNEAPDILVLNEAGWLIDPKGVKDLSLELGLPYFYLAKSGNYLNHVAIFSKFRLKDAVDIPGLKNAALVASVESNLGNISIAGVHLASNTEDTRVTEISKIISQQRLDPNKIILGDLNSISPENIVNSHNPSGIKELPTRYDVVERIKNAGYQDAAVVTKKEKIPTVPLTQDNGITYYDLRLDYIFLSLSLVKRLVDYRVIINETTRLCSDHYPVVIYLGTENGAV